MTGPDETDLARLRDDLAALKGVSRRRGASTAAAGFFMIAGLAAYVRESMPGEPATAVARVNDAVASSSTRPRALGDNEIAEAFALIEAYRPTAARLTVGEILEPMLGKELKPSAFEISPTGLGVYEIVFKPFTDDVGLAHLYSFRVDVDLGRVEPLGQTQQLLRSDAAGRLASRSDFEGLRQTLDLSRESEVLVGESSR
jgi:hypothetical protein